MLWQDVSKRDLNDCICITGVTLLLVQLRGFQIQISNMHKFIIVTLSVICNALSVFIIKLILCTQQGRPQCWTHFFVLSVYSIFNTIWLYGFQQSEDPPGNWWIILYWPNTLYYELTFRKQMTLSFSGCRLMQQNIWQNKWKWFYGNTLGQATSYLLLPDNRSDSGMGFSTDGSLCKQQPECLGWLWQHQDLSGHVKHYFTITLIAYIFIS